MPTFLVERTPGSDWVGGVDTRAQPLWEEHATFMDDLFERGFIVLAGPIVGGDGEALVVMEAESEDELRALLEGDPWCAARDTLRTGRVRRWRVFLDVRGR